MHYTSDSPRIIRRTRRRGRDGPFSRTSLQVGNCDLTLNLTILVGTMTGTAEMVAQEVQTALEAGGHVVTIRMMDDLDASVFESGGTFLICTSTYGQGDVPDNAQEFFASLERERPNLSSVTYGLIALGDRTYRDTFCEGGTRFNNLLTELGAKRVGEILKHDASSGTLPEEVAAQWIVPWAEQATAAPAGTFAGKATDAASE
jgi:MioC protein